MFFLRHPVIFRNWVINVSNQNCIYYRLFWCQHIFFVLKINKVTIIWKNMRSFCATLYNVIGHQVGHLPRFVAGCTVSKTQITFLDFCFFLARQPPRGPGPSHSRGFLFHTQRRTTVGKTPLDEWSRSLPDNTQHSQQTNIHAPGGIRTHSLSRRAAADLRIRARGQWDRHTILVVLLNYEDP